MAFPSVATRNSGSSGEADAYPISMPSGLQAGDGVLVAVATGLQLRTGFVTPPSFTAQQGGWAKLAEMSVQADRSSNNFWDCTAAVFYKQVTGAEALTINQISNIPSESTHVSYRIVGGGTPVVGIYSTTTATPRTPSLTVPGGAREYLWLSILAIGFADKRAPSVAPFGYSNLVTATRFVDDDSSSFKYAIGGSQRQIAANAETPGNFTLNPATFSLNGLCIGMTVAIPPIGAAGFFF